MEDDISDVANICQTCQSIERSILISKITYTTDYKSYQSWHELTMMSGLSSTFKGHVEMIFEPLMRLSLNHALQVKP